MFKLHLTLFLTGCCIVLHIAAQAQNPIADTLLARHYQKKAKIFTESAQYDSAFAYYNAGGKIYRAFAEEKGDAVFWREFMMCWIEAGEILSKKQDLSNAQRYFEQALKLGEKHLGDYYPDIAKSYDKVGLIYYNNLNYEQALAYFQQALDVRIQIFGENHLELTNSYNNLGNVFHALGQYEQALAYFQEELDIQIEALENPHPLIARSYHNMGVIYSKKGAHNQALTYLKQALNIQLQLFDESHLDVNYLCYSLGTIYASLGKIDSALYYFQQALTVFRQNFGDIHPIVANLYNNIGNVCDLKGDYEQALAFHHQALDIRLKTLDKNHPDIAYSYHNLGTVYYYLGDYKRAQKNFQEALSIQRQTQGENHPALASLYNNLGSVFQNKGDYEKALIYFEQAINIWLKTVGEYHPNIATAYENMGSIYVYKKAYDQALSYDLKALKIRLDSLGENHQDVAHSYNNLVHIYNEIDDYDNALAYAQKSLDILVLKFDESHPGIADSHKNLGKVYYNKDDYKRAFLHFQQALNMQIEIFGATHPDIANTYQNIGNVYLEQEAYEQALIYLQKALSIFSPSLNEMDIYQNPSLKTSELDLKLLDILIVKANAFRQQFSVSAQTKDLKASLNTFELAADLVDLLLRIYTFPSSKEILIENSFLIYEGAIAVGQILQQEDPSFSQRAFMAAERSKAILLLEAVRNSAAKDFAGVPAQVLEQEQAFDQKIATYHRSIREAKQIENKTSPEQLKLWQSKIFQFSQSRDSLLKIMEKNYPKYYRLKYDVSVAKLEDVQANLSDSTAIIEYFMGDSNLYIFTITHDQHFLHKVPIDFSFHMRIKRFISLVDTPTIGSEIVAEDTIFQRMAQLGHQLYQTLLADALSPIETRQLIIIPDGLLGYLPFDLLLYAPVKPNEYYGDLAYLLRAYKVRYEYSATLLLEEQTSHSSKPSSSYVGYAPSYPKEDDFLVENRTLGRLYPSVRDGWGSLIYNQPEVRAASQLLKGTSYLDTTATERTFKRTAGQYQILHLAMHALLNDSLPLYSGLAFAANSDSTEDNFLHTYELYDLPLNADLAVLSACHSGAGKIQRGEGIMSLARAFKYAGCPNIVMSLWQADDKATKEIISAFFGFLKQKLPKDEALRKAKLGYLDHAPPPTQHPFYWGTLALVGDDQPIEMSTPWWHYLVGILLLMTAFGISVYLFQQNRKHRLLQFL